MAGQVVVLAPRGRDAAVLADLVAALGGHARICPDLASVLAAMGDDAIAVLVTEEELNGPALAPLQAWIAAQPSWSDLPFLVLGGRTTRSYAQAALLGSLGNAVLLERPLAIEALATAVGAAMRARSRQLQVRDEVAAREKSARALLELNHDLERRVAARTAELAASETRFRSYFETFPEALFVIAVNPAGAFTYQGLNPEAERILGVQSAASVGKPPQMLLPAPAAKVAEDEFRRCVELGRVLRYTQTLAHGQDSLTFDVVLTPMRDAEGRITGLLGAARDVTQQRQLEERLRQAQKLEALGQLTGGVAHDFNNLLQVITSGLVLVERAQDAARRARLVDSMRRAADRGADLVRRLLAFGRRQALRPEPIALGPWLEAHVRDLLSRALRGNIIVRTRLSPGLPPVQADAAELELALLNLALNARDAMPAGGELVIEAEPVALAAYFNPEGLEGDFVRLSVSDNGTGMTPEIVARLFEPFFTTKEPGHGTGLGLAQVYGFVRQSGGAVRVSSQPGRGTSVSLILPVAEGAPAAAPPPPPRPPVSRPLEVLLCEDDDAVASLVSQLLSQLGHHTRRVATGREALSVLNDGAPVDLLLTDVIMPGSMDGAALAREAARRWPDLPILLTTGYQGEAEAEGLPVLRKPYHIDDLAAALAQVTG